MYIFSIFEISCVSCTYSTSQPKLATFQVLNCRMWPVVPYWAAQYYTDSQKHWHTPSHTLHPPPPQSFFLQKRPPQAETLPWAPTFHIPYSLYCSNQNNQHFKGIDSVHLALTPGLPTHDLIYSWHQLFGEKLSPSLERRAWAAEPAGNREVLPGGRGSRCRPRGHTHGLPLHHSVHTQPGRMATLSLSPIKREGGKSAEKMHWENSEDHILRTRAYLLYLTKAPGRKQEDKDEAEEWMATFSSKLELKDKSLIEGTGHKWWKNELTERLWQRFLWCLLPG